MDELSQYVGSYDYAPGLKATLAGSETAGVWWLRSPNLTYSGFAGVVYDHGYVPTTPMSAMAGQCAPLLI